MKPMQNMDALERLRELAERGRKAQIDVDAIIESQRANALDPRELDLLPELPAGWQLAHETPDGAKYLWRGGLSVIVSAATELDGRRWLHVSVCRLGKGVNGKQKTKTPSYFDLKLVKEIFIGADRKAVQVFSPESEHVNLHDHVLHLFACLDEDPFPDFTRGLGTI